MPYCTIKKWLPFFARDDFDYVKLSKKQSIYMYQLKPWQNTSVALNGFKIDYWIRKEHGGTIPTT